MTRSASSLTRKPPLRTKWSAEAELGGGRVYVRARSVATFVTAVMATGAMWCQNVHDASPGVPGHRASARRVAGRGADLQSFEMGRHQNVCVATHTAKPAPTNVLTKSSCLCTHACRPRRKYVLKTDALMSHSTM